MKKIVSAVLTVSLVSALFACTPSAAEAVTVELDGKTLAFDVAPQIMDDRVMVPLRTVFEEIGALVKWDGETQTVSARKNAKTVTLTVDSPKLVVDKGKTDENGDPITETVYLDAPATVVSDRTLVPVRAVSEGFGLAVDWNEEEQKVIITSDKTTDDSWKDNLGSADLTAMTCTGDGISIENGRVLITAGGDYTLTGTLSDGGITVSTDERVKLRLSGVSVTATDEPCIDIDKADKAYITVTKDTENTLVTKNGKAAIVSSDDLVIKGKGMLTVKAENGHGIKASDNLSIENGSLYILAGRDGLHVNDTFEMTDGSVHITAVGDGIDSESIVLISGGLLEIETTGTPTVGTNTQSTENGRRFPQEQTSSVEFESSTKGIKAEWMLCITGGDITVRASHHAIHCADAIEISGGVLMLSSEYGKGISAHGNLTVSGSETVIDVTKCTEGLESKNILTVNDGTISVVASDDAINATGGNSGNDMGMGGMGFGGPNQAPNGRGERGERTNAEPTPNRTGRGDSRDRDGQGTQPTEKPNASERPPEMPNDRDFGENPPTPPEPSDGGGQAPDQAGGQTVGRAEPSENGGFGGRGRAYKDCLVINGGTLTLYAEDDCLDSNGNLIINGGTVMATKTNGSFTGFESILDPDGSITIGEQAVLVFAVGKGNECSFTLSQSSILLQCDASHASGDTVTLADKNGHTLYTYTPNGTFRAVLIASASLTAGETYTLTVGDEEHEVTASAQIEAVRENGGAWNRPR